MNFKSVGGLLLAFVVSGCVAAGVEPPSDTPRIVVSSGGTFSGSSTTSIYADDTISLSSAEPFAEAGKPAVKKGSEGRALAIVQSEGPRVKARRRVRRRRWYG